MMLGGAENFIQAITVAQQTIEVTKRGLDGMLHVYHNIEVHPCLLPSFIVSYKSN